MKIQPKPGNEAIAAQLSRILASPAFERSKRLSSLLQYLVAETLDGRGERIKALTIAMDIFGRDESFDQQRDTIVRVEAGRLRRALKDYYQEEGKLDPILIHIPKGTYRPVISSAQIEFPELRPETPVVTPPAPNRHRDNPDRRVIYLTAVITSITLVMMAWVLYRGAATSPVGGQADTQAGPAVSDKPYLMILPVTTTSVGELQQLALGMAESLITQLAKLSGLSVMAHASVLNSATSEVSIDARKLQGEYGVTHLLRTNLAERQGKLRVSVQLLETRTGQILWAESFERSADDHAPIEKELALRIATELSIRIQPDERSRISSSHTDNPEAWVLYRQGLVMLIPPNDITRIETARRLFRRATELDPDFAGGYAGESFSHSISLLFLKAAEPEKELARAIPLAEQAIAVDDGFAMGYATLSFAQLFAEETEKALANARHATEIQPGDAFARFILGMNLVIAGKPSQAIASLEQARRLDPLEARTPYLNVLGIAHYAAGNYEQAVSALELNRQRVGPVGPHMDIFLAASYAALERESEAMSLLRSIEARYPDFPASRWTSNWLAASDQLLRMQGFLESSTLP